MARSLVVGLALALSLSPFGCSKSSSSAPPQSPRVAQPPSAATVAGTRDPQTQKPPPASEPKPEENKSQPQSPPPEEAPVAAPSKPAEEPSESWGGGPNEIGGAVFGDGDDGNTGHDPGGEAPPGH